MCPLYFFYFNDLNAMFKLSSDIVIGRDCIFNKRTGEAYLLENSLMRLLEHRDFNELEKEENFKLKKQLLKQGIIFDDKFQENKEIFHVQWHILNDCNLRCKHCYDWKEKENVLNFGQLCKVVDDYVFFLKKMGFNGEISLTGGEPTMHQQLFDLIEYIKRKEVYIGLYILTNGINISDEFINIAKNYNIGVQVSLDGSESVHDSIRGKGSYNKTISNITKLLKNGVRVAVHYVIMKKNMTDIEPIIFQLDSIGVKRLNFSTLIPIGPGAQEQTVSSIQLKGCMELIRDLQEKVDISIIGQRPLWAILGYDGVCPIGYRTLTIDAKGDFLPCRRLPIRLGNVLEDSWFDVWLNNDFLCMMRDRSHSLSKCGKCKFLDKCAGCRAMAMAMTGDPFGKDEYCWFGE